RMFAHPSVGCNRPCLILSRVFPFVVHFASSLHDPAAFNRSRPSRAVTTLLATLEAASGRLLDPGAPGHAGRGEPQPLSLPAQHRNGDGMADVDHSQILGSAVRLLQGGTRP